MLYITQLPYPGHVQTSASDQGIVHYQDKLTTVQEYLDSHPNCHALTWDELYPHIQAYETSLCGPWKEITEDDYSEALNCLPPERWHKCGPDATVFFISEPYTGTLHSAYISSNERYYSALRDITMKSQDIYNNFTKQYENPNT